MLLSTTQFLFNLMKYVTSSIFNAIVCLCKCAAMHEHKCNVCSCVSVMLATKFLASTFISAVFQCQHCQLIKYSTKLYLKVKAYLSILIFPCRMIFFPSLPIFLFLKIQIQPVILSTHGILNVAFFLCLHESTLAINHVKKKSYKYIYTFLKQKQLQKRKEKNKKKDKPSFKRGYKTNMGQCHETNINHE